MKRVIFLATLVIGMITVVQAQDKSFTTGKINFVDCDVNADIDSSEIYTIQVLLTTSSQPIVYAQINIDSLSGTGKCEIYRYYKLFKDDSPTYIDTVIYAGTGTDTTFNFASASAVNYRYLGITVKGTGGSVTFDNAEVKGWE